MFAENDIETSIKEHTIHYAHELFYRRSIIISAVSVGISLLNIALYSVISRTSLLKNSETNYFIMSTVLSSMIQHEVLKFTDEIIIQHIANYYKKKSALTRSTKKTPLLRNTLLILTFPSMLTYWCFNRNTELCAYVTIFSATISFFLTIHKIFSHQTYTRNTIQRAIDTSFSGKYHGTWNEISSAYSLVLTYTPHKKVMKKFRSKKIDQYLDAYITKYLFSHCRVLGTSSKLFFIIYPSLCIATSPTIKLRDYLKDIAKKEATIRYMYKPVNRKNTPSPTSSPRITPPASPLELKRSETHPDNPARKVRARRRKLPFLSRPAVYGISSIAILQKIQALSKKGTVESIILNGQPILLTSYSKKDFKHLLTNKFNIQQRKNATWKINFKDQSISVRFNQTIINKEIKEEAKESISISKPPTGEILFTPSTLPRNVELLQIALQRLIGRQKHIALSLFLSHRDIEGLDSAIKILLTIQRMRCCTVAIAGGALRSILLEQKPRDVDFISGTEKLMSTQSITPELHTRTSSNPKKKMCHLLYLGDKYEMSYTENVRSMNGLDFTVNGLVYDGKNLFARHPLTLSDIQSKTLRLVHSIKPENRPDYYALMKKILITSAIHKQLDMEIALQNIITLLLNPKLLMRASIRILRDDFTPTKDLQIILVHASQQLYEALPMEAELSFWIHYFEHHMTTIFSPALQQQFMALPATRGFFSAIITEPAARETFISQSKQPSSINFLFRTLLKAKAMLSLALETPCLLILIARLSLHQQPDEKSSLKMGERIANQGIRLFPEYLKWSEDECATVINLGRNPPGMT